MEKLVLSEIYQEIYGNHKSILKKLLSLVVKTIVMILLMILTFNNIDENSVLLILLVSFCSGNFVGAKIPDVIYMLPGAIKDYIFAKMRYTVIIEILFVVIGIGVRMVWALIMDDTEIINEIMDISTIFTILGFITYTIIKNVWLMYYTHSEPGLYQEKFAQGCAAMIFFVTDTLVNSPDNAIPMIIVKISLLVGFGIYAVYICRFVKKNMVIVGYQTKNVAEEI